MPSYTVTWSEITYKIKRVRINDAGTREEAAAKALALPDHHYATETLWDEDKLQPEPVVILVTEEGNENAQA